MLIGFLVIVYFITSLFYEHIALPVGGFLQRTATVFFCGPTLVFAAVQEDHIMIIGILVFTFVIFWMFGRDLGLFTELIEECLYVSVMIYFFRLGLLGGKLRLFWAADGLMAAGAVLYLYYYALKCKKIQKGQEKAHGPRLTRAERPAQKQEAKIQAAVDAHEKKLRREAQARTGQSPEVADLMEELDQLSDVNVRK